MNIIFALLTSIFFLTSCATSPTGRKQLQLLPQGQMNAMGVQAFSQIKEKTPTHKNPKVQDYIQCIVRPLLLQIDSSKGMKNWEVVVFDEPKTVNAFALPGGKIGVYSGIMKVARSPGQLAAILGHEIGHVMAQHGNERISETLLTQGGLTAIGVLTQKNPRHKLIMGLLGLGTQFGLLLPHSRTQESEADTIGVKLMVEAGFDPRESVKLWQNMDKASQDKVPEFASTHPSHTTRIKRLQELMGSSSAIYQQALQKGKRPHCEL